ncbi:MAG: hypothetical protein KIS66_16660 [Fimbriimonadaceae bacterium]|nr:hypothetical protein [Fimbriimonadaceae bacterium]
MAEVTPSQYAKRIGVSRQRVMALIREGRIAARLDATEFGPVWRIEENQPEPERKVRGRPRKERP